MVLLSVEADLAPEPAPGAEDSSQAVTEWEQDLDPDRLDRKA